MLSHACEYIDIYIHVFLIFSLLHIINWKPKNYMFLTNAVGLLLSSMQESSDILYILMIINF